MDPHLGPVGCRHIRRHRIPILWETYDPSLQNPFGATALEMHMGSSLRDLVA
jgi:hypothetical protein